MSCLQKAGSQGDFQFQLSDKAEATFRYRREESRLYRIKAGEQRGIRTAISSKLLRGKTLRRSAVFGFIRRFSGGRRVQEPDSSGLRPGSDAGAQS
ncbi:MAG TPA: hypothetical protein VEH04_05805 [Verrucomicrobiae bacterium]|nr:hypothetical protein [Verrucomicrobiae bacterium]